MLGFAAPFCFEEAAVKSAMFAGFPCKVLVEQAHAFELTSLCDWKSMNSTAKRGWLCVSMEENIPNIVINYP